MRRPKWQTGNIRFKMATDDDGMYNGMLTHAQKRTATNYEGMGYIKCYIPGMELPMMCLVDFRGFRLMAKL